MRHSHSKLWIAGALVYIFLYIPLAIVVIYSFNDSKLNTEWVGFTLSWYEALFNNKEMLIAVCNSLIIAISSSFGATILGTMAGLAIHRYKLRVLSILFFAPIAMPEILLGVSLLLFFLLVLNLTLGMVSIIIAHTTFCIGFVAIIVKSRLQDMDESIFESARDLGASSWQCFHLVTLPLIMPAMIAGALMSFTLSIDDFIITFFTKGVGDPILPIQIYTMIKVAVTPEVNAISTLLMLLTLFTIIIGIKLSSSFLYVRKNNESM